MHHPQCSIFTFVKIRVWVWMYAKNWILGYISVYIRVKAYCWNTKNVNQALVWMERYLFLLRLQVRLCDLPGMRFRRLAFTFIQHPITDKWVELLLATMVEYEKGSYLYVLFKYTIVSPRIIFTKGDQRLIFLLYLSDEGFLPISGSTVIVE